MLVSDSKRSIVSRERERMGSRIHFRHPADCFLSLHRSCAVKPAKATKRVREMIVTERSATNCKVTKAKSVSRIARRHIRRMIRRSFSSTAKASCRLEEGYRQSPFSRRQDEPTDMARRRNAAFALYAGRRAACPAGGIGCLSMFFTNEGAIAKFFVAVGLGSSSNAQRWTRF